VKMRYLYIAALPNMVTRTDSWMNSTLTNHNHLFHFGAVVKRIGDVGGGPMYPRRRLNDPDTAAVYQRMVCIDAFPQCSHSLNWHLCNISKLGCSITKHAHEKEMPMRRFCSHPVLVP
jgi:hypothetical protein